MSPQKSSVRQRKQLKMTIKKVIILAAILMSGLVRGQDEEKVLFSIEGSPVYNAEFIRVFEKNKDIVVEDDRKDFDHYFDLFVDFRLKLVQARALHLDTLSSYTSDLSAYREQLIQPYLQNPEATENLVREAYDRTVEEVAASHILVMVKADADPVDTLKAYQKISTARIKILNGASFDSIARIYSEDPSVQMNNGSLGYFSAFSMVYSFENAAYNTPVGQVSEPFRTQFGYHILQVNDKRKSPGEIQVAHIMVKNDSTVLRKSKEKIDEIFKKLEQGDDFTTIAKEHSDDLSSAQKGGVLPKFGTGRMIKSFEDVGFALENEGDFSKPFESEYGWHILKLLKKYPIGSYEELHAKLESKVKNGSRSSYVERSLAQKVAKDYQVVTYKVNLRLYPNIIGFENSKDTLLRVEDKLFKGYEFYSFAKDFKDRSKEDLFDEFRNKMIIDYYKEHLDETNKEFALTYQEYKDGLLLFELLQRQVWEKSEKDSVGLQRYFDKNRSKYFWKRRADLIIASCTRLEKAKIVQSLLLEGKHPDTIKSMVNEGATIHVLFSKGKLEEGSSKLPDGFIFKLGVSQIFEEEEHHFTIINVEDIFEPQPKELKETRGEVMNDYQNYLESQWVKDLRQTYKIKVNQKNYKELKQRFTTP